MLHVEKMQQSDFRFAVDLANTMDWNMAEIDFEFMRNLEPGGCFVLFDDRKRIGIATCISYGKVGWFGNLVVESERRRKGAGTFLVKHAVGYLKSLGVVTIGLFAYQHLVDFYENVGFQPHGKCVLMSGVPVGVEPEETFKKAVPTDVPALLEFASNCLEGYRGKLLRLLLEDEANFCHFCSSGGEIIGFALARVYDKMAELSPLACKPDREDVAVSLVGNILQELAGKEVFAYVPTKEKALMASFEGSGLEERVRLTRMFLGPIPNENCIYLPESLERG